MQLVGVVSLDSDQQRVLLAPSASRAGPGLGPRSARSGAAPGRSGGSVDHARRPPHSLGVQSGHSGARSSNDYTLLLIVNTVGAGLVWVDVGPRPASPRDGGTKLPSRADGSIRIQDIDMLSPSTGRVRPVFTLFLTLLALPRCDPGSRGRPEPRDGQVLRADQATPRRRGRDGGRPQSVHRPGTAGRQRFVGDPQGARGRIEEARGSREEQRTAGGQRRLSRGRGPGRKKTVVRIIGRVVDQNNGRLLGECEVEVDNLTSIAGLLGATMDVPPDALREDRERAIREGIRKPTAPRRLDADLGRAQEPVRGRDPGRPRRSAGSSGPVRPRSAGGQAYMNIRTRRAVRRQADQRRAVRGGGRPSRSTASASSPSAATRNTAT